MQRSAHRLVALQQRGFKQAAKAAPAKKKGDSGRDPYAVFKQAILAEPEPDASLAEESPGERAAWRSTYSRHKMREHQRVNGHLSRLIKLREEAVAALPEALRAAARQRDSALLPVQRRVFTETAPIPNFQAKLAPDWVDEA